MKVIHILLIIIVILGTLLGIKVYNSNKKPEYTLSDIQLILKKADQLTNYECEMNLGQFKYYKRKDNKIFLQSDTDSNVYRDYDKETEIMYKNINEKKLYIERKIENTEIPSSNSYTFGLRDDDILSIIAKNLKNVETESYKGITCLKLELQNDIEQVVKYWVNLDTGLIMKTKFGDGTIKEYTYKFNTVTDEDVTADLAGYTKIEEN